MFNLSEIGLGDYGRISYLRIESRDRADYRYIVHEFRNTRELVSSKISYAGQTPGHRKR
jgi:hypothetical protein